LQKSGNHITCATSEKASREITVTCGLPLHSLHYILKRSEICGQHVSTLSEDLFVNIFFPASSGQTDNRVRNSLADQEDYRALVANPKVSMT